MLHFQPMTEPEFFAFKTWILEDYARDIAAMYRVGIEEARQSSASQTESMMSQGLATPNQLFYNLVITDGTQPTHIGYLWIDVDEQKKRCFISEIHLFPEYRHQGWGRKTLEQLETEMQQRGIHRIGLHVFANNQIARQLYEKMGYQPMGINMQKWLNDPE